MDFYERQILQKIYAQDAVVRNVFNMFVRGVSPELKKYRLSKEVWVKNASIEANINKELEKLQTNLETLIIGNQKWALELSKIKNDKFIQDYLKGMAISSVVKDGFMQRRGLAFEQAAKRELIVSDRVWNIGQGTKQQLEFYVQSGITSGRSANEISSDIRQLLREPDKRFRRIRDPETGKLTLSQPMKDYHPGQGQYRSAYKNARRLAANEINYNYRQADYERWQALDFITGIKVSLSNAHHITMPHGDICDHMAGVYPKEFRFIGWHVLCMCHATSVTIPQEDFLDYLDTDKVPDKYVVKSIPKEAQDYINKHAKQIEGWKSKPYWFDNFKKKGSVYQFTPPAKTVTVIAPVSNAFSKVSPGIEKHFNYAVALIDRVHDDGKLPRIPINSRANLEAGGHYKFTKNRRTGEFVDSVNITINQTKPTPEFSIIHEIGHFIDHRGIGLSKEFDSISGTNLTQFMKVVQESSPIKTLKEAKRTGKLRYKGEFLELNKKRLNHIDYLLGNDEIWARAYSQYITTKTQDKLLLKQLEIWRKHPFPYQWEDKEFEKIVKAIDDLMEKLQWTKKN